MDLRPKCKTGHYKTVRGNIGRTLFDINHSKIFFDPPPRVKNKQMRPNET